VNLLAKVLFAAAVSASVVGIQPASATVSDCSNTFPIASRQASASPSNIAPIAGTQVTNEGIWHDTRISVLGKIAVKTTQLRFDKAHGKATATIVWLDPKAVAFSQIGGTTDPINNPKASGKVPASLKSCYLAGFHGGYLTKTKNHHINDSQGGAIYNGYTALPMVDGKATLMTYSDGSIDIVNWPNWNHSKTIAQARQNISMIVKDGVSQVKSPELHNAWGWVWNGVGINNNDVPRSGVGIRADGTVVWVLGNKLNATNLASLLVRAGSVRAMVLDMNKGYSNGYFYGPYHTVKSIGSKINPSMVGEPSRFWQTSQRDFVAVFARP
jgi:hypothetical protein